MDEHSYEAFSCEEKLIETDTATFRLIAEIVTSICYVICLTSCRIVYFAASRHCPLPHPTLASVTFCLEFSFSHIQLPPTLYTTYMFGCWCRFRRVLVCDLSTCAFTTHRGAAVTIEQSSWYQVLVQKTVPKKVVACSSRSCCRECVVCICVTCTSHFLAISLVHKGPS